jgi:hypothetical protein
MRWWRGLVLLGGTGVLALIGCGGAPGAPEGSAGAQVAPDGAATVPVSIDHNRLIVDVDLVRPDGGVRRAAAWVDTGNQYLIVVQDLARELGIDDSLLDAGSDHSVESSSPAPAMAIGGVALTTDGVGVRVRPGTWVQNGVPAEMFLPASALRGLHVVFDGPARQMTVAPPGVLTPHGEPVPCRVNPETGLLMIEATVEGEPVSLGVDTGSAGTWVSRTVAERWPDHVPDLAWAVGAAGSANFFGNPFETQGALTSLPELGIGSLRVTDVAVLALGQSLFDWYSEKSAAPVSGFLGSNAIDRCRLEIDWPQSMTWWEVGPEPAQRDLDIVGLTLRPEPDGSFTVAGVVIRDGVPTVTGVEPGDVLLRVGELNVPGSTMGEVVGALRGRPGEVLELELQRDAERITVEAQVTRLPS